MTELDLEMLDVTRIEPRLKHPTIFQHFDALEEGQSFIIHNDHDPRPLYYQLQAERGDIFTWEYLKQGQDVFEIKISKKILSSGEETIGQMAGKDLRTAEVFKRMGLEFCCDGNKTLDAACKIAGVAVADVKKALSEIPETPVSPDRDFNRWKLDFLADYIVNIHHSYVQERVKPLSELSEKINHVHGGAHPELATIRDHVKALLKEMIAHQEKEETVLFPFIKQMVKAEREKKPLNYSSFSSVEDPVALMHHDHKAVADHIHTIDHLSGGYKVPADGCESYKLYYHMLEELDDDLHQHIHLENNILFPKAINLEKSLEN